MPGLRPLIVLAVVAAAVVLFVVLRPGDDEAPSPDPAAAPTAPAPAETETDAAPPATEPAEEPEEVGEAEESPAEPEPATLSIVVRGGIPEDGIQRLTVARGEEVRIVVRSDSLDEVHLHGYELVRPMGPGAPAQMRFRATTPGRFELETHERHVLIGELEVRP